MVDFDTSIVDHIATDEPVVDVKAASLIGKAKAAYVAGWPYWAPAVVVAALIGHIL